MDKTVIILIGAGVCCVVIGLALFVKLLTTKPDYSDEETGRKKLLDEDYMENFQECFDDTENIEDTLDQLASIYTNDQYMYNLITNALDFIRDEQGDYETALDGINVDSDQAVAKMHNAAIKKALNLDAKPAIARRSTKNEKAEQDSEADLRNETGTEKTAGVKVNDSFDEDDEGAAKADITKPAKKRLQKPAKIESDEFEEDEDEPVPVKPEKKKEQTPKKSVSKPAVKKERPETKKPVVEDDGFDEFEEDEEPVVKKKQEKIVKPEEKKEQKKEAPKKKPEVSEDDEFDDYMDEPPKPVVKKETKKINKKPAPAKVEEEEDDDDDLDGFKIG